MQAYEYAYTAVADNLSRLTDAIQAAAAAAGREAADVRLMAVSKFHPEEAVRAAYAAGIRYFGENRVQEAVGKYAQLIPVLPDLRVHMIGSLQSNKVNKALGLFHAIQSVDSLSLLVRILERAPAALDLYLELHTGEASKAGFPHEDELFKACEYFVAWREGLTAARGGPSAAAQGSVRLAGLMTMAPFTDDKTRIRASFARLRRALAAVQARFDLPDCRELSMGMSNDYVLAVQEGSTMLRIGTALFGTRAAP